jgi:hypothetical protein
MIITVGFSQSKTTNSMVVKETIKIENMAMTVTVDSAEEVASIFKIEDIAELVEGNGENESFSFKIICNGDNMSNGKSSYVSYKVEGNSADPDGFLKSVEAIKKAAIKYYNNKE